MRSARFKIAVAISLALALTGVSACGDDAGTRGEPTRATLVLDYLPNGVHAGVYEALASGAYLDRGIELEVITPTSTADTIRLIQSGKADFGLADGIDIATQIDAGRDARAIMAITQRPSGGLITLAGDDILSPAGLAGKTVGVTGVPSDTAVFETMVEDAGGDPDASKVVTVGFGGIQALLAGRISAFTGYIPADSPVVESKGRRPDPSPSTTSVARPIRAWSHSRQSRASPRILSWSRDSSRRRSSVTGRRWRTRTERSRTWSKQYPNWILGWPERLCWPTSP